MPSPSPLPATSRLRALDGLRGLALLGILLVNIQYWSGWMLMTPEQQVAHAGETVRHAHGVAERLLLDGKFYTLFSLLFGVGCAMQLHRLQAAGHDGTRIYRRRLVVLLLMGLLHTLLVWDGDILTLYALLGFALPWFARLRDRSLLIWAAVLVFAVPLAGQAVFVAKGWNPGERVMGLALDWLAAMGGDPAPDAGVRWLQQGGWRELLAWLSSGTVYTWGLRLESWRIPKVLGIMVLGLWVGRRVARGEVVGDVRLLRRVLSVGLLVGLPATLVYAFHDRAGQFHWSSMVGTVPLALAYASAFLLAWPRAQRLLGMLADAGRMPLSNYLAQSVVNGLVFFGVGLGLIGRLPLSAVYLYAMTLFGLQLLGSRWWLARHPQGPVEAVWRRLTYPDRAAGAVAAVKT